MKKIALTLVLLLTSLSFIQAQCVREGALEAIDDPDQYPVTGTAQIEFLLDGTKQVVFQDDFETVQGIELRVFLTTTPRLDQGGVEQEVTTEPLQDDNGGQDTGDIISGFKSFDMPDDIELADFQYVIIQCVQADVLWGRTLLGEAQGADCESLSTEETTLINTSIFPNPATNVLHINNGAQLSEISVFNLLGKKVYSQNSIVDINLENLASGVYLVRLTEQEKQETIKLIIQ